jgi:hypothetical protein
MRIYFYKENKKNKIGIYIFGGIEMKKTLLFTLFALIISGCATSNSEYKQDYFGYNNSAKKKDKQDDKTIVYEVEVSETNYYGGARR